MVPQAPQAIWIGIDVAKQSVVAAIALPAHGGEYAAYPARQFPRTAEGARQLAEWAAVAAPQAPLRAVMEATGAYSTQFAAMLDGAGLPGAAIVNPSQPHHYARSLGARNKTDWTDARILACFGAERHPVAPEPQDPAYVRLRDLSRARQRLVEARVRSQEALGEATDELVRRAYAAVAATLDEQVEALEAEIEELCAGAPELAADCALLDTVYGVAALTARTILAELGDLRRFRSRDQLAAFAGLTPRLRNSGKSKGRSPITKCGSARARRVLYIAAMTAVRGDNHLARAYRAFIARGTPRRVALIAIARRMLLEMRAMLIANKPWNPHIDRERQAA